MEGTYAESTRTTCRLAITRDSLQRRTSNARGGNRQLRARGKSFTMFPLFIVLRTFIIIIVISIFPSQPAKAQEGVAPEKERLADMKTFMERHGSLRALPALHRHWLRHAINSSKVTPAT